MAYSIDESPDNICFLLFVRSAWGIAPDAEVPVLDPAPDAGGSALPAAPGLQEWTARWNMAWSRAWAWYGIQERMPWPPPEELLRRVPTPGQPLHPLIPPDWQTEYGDDDVDDAAYRRWHEMVRPMPPVPHKIKETPERLSLPALIEAWHGGLDSIVTLPYRGYYARRITPRHLLVSAATRNNPDWYSRALTSTH